MVRHMTTARVTSIVLVGLLLLTGCSGSSDSAGAGDGAAVAYASAGAEAADDAEATAEREVITTGSLTLVADDAETAADDVVALVERAGGRVDGRSQQRATDEQEASAWLSVRVPAAKVTETLTAAEEIGEVSNLSLTSDDVTRQGKDLDARIAALETSTERLVALMADADSSEALLAAEKALSERQGDLEALRSERDYLSDQVAMSTLVIDVVTEETAQFEAGGFVGGLTSGWNALVAFASALLVGLGAALPWLLVLGVPVLVAVLIARRSRKRPTLEA